MAFVTHENQLLTVYTLARISDTTVESDTTTFDIQFPSVTDVVSDMCTSRTFEPITVDPL